MPKKATKTKETPIVLDLSKPFDLSDVRKETLATYAGYLASMVTGSGWKLLEQILKENLVVIEQQIITKASIEGGALDEKSVDELRVQHAQIKQLLKTPYDLIKKFGKQPGQQPQMEFDPYSRSGMKDEFIINASTMT